MIYNFKLNIKLVNIMAKKNQLNNDNILRYPEEDFIPYACYIDKQTIMTKNADLMMTFKIPSLVSNSAKVELFDIRENFRLILSTYFKNQNISFYFTTLRKKADIIPYGEEKKYFGKRVSEIWNEQNNWYNQFVNEIYITAIISPEVNENLINPLFFISSMTQTGVNSIYSKAIEKAHKVLKKLASNILSKMADYDIRILSMAEEKDGAIYSEHMRFFSLLINMEKMDFPVTYDSISDVIRQKKIAYGSDIVESDKNGDKKFASVFSVKSFQDLTLGQLDKLLQLPMEMVITETASFVDNKYVTSLYDDSKYITSLSEDVDLAYISGLDALVSSNTGKDNDYCIGQTSIMVINQNINDLTSNIKQLYKAFDEVGLVGVRENVFLPTIFWSQLPGNFRYLKRFHIAPTSKLGNYLSLFNFPTGKLRYNYWGNAITIIPTALNTPYFFNFHNQQNGNTAIVGLEGTGKTTIMNFLLSQTSRVDPKIFYIDTQRSSEVFINAMGGKYYKISPSSSEEERFKINPFILDNTLENERFLNDFIKNIVDFQDDGFIEMKNSLTQLKSQYKHISTIVKQIFSMAPEERTFENISNLFNVEKTNLIYEKLAFWYKKQQTSFIFNNKITTPINDKIVGISLKTIIENKNLIIPVVSYLFNIINDMADGEPFILAIDNAWEIVDNEKIAPMFLKMLESLPKKNVAVIVTTDGESKISESSILEPINKYFATELYLGNPKISAYQRKVFSLQEEEARILALMKTNDRNFLLKCINDIIISSINLKNFEFYTKIFSNDNISINAMKKAKETTKSEKPEVWVPVFIKILEEYEKTIKMKRLKENEKNQIRWEEARTDENNKNKIINKN